MIRRPPRSTRTDTLFPYTTLFRSQTKPDTAAPSQHAHATATASAFDVPGIARPAVSVVDDFARALAAGDLSTVETLLDADVLVLESGGAERSREQYLGHHAVSDARFLKGSQRKITRSEERRVGKECVSTCRYR